MLSIAKEVVEIISHGDCENVPELKALVKRICKEIGMHYIEETNEIKYFNLKRKGD